MNVVGYLKCRWLDSPKNVFVEKGESYEVFWFVWERDGVFPWEDWEPVIIVHNDSGFCEVSVRRGYMWIDYNNSDLEEIGIGLEKGEIPVIFECIHHHPFISIPDEKCCRINVSYQYIDRSQVPSFAREPAIQKMVRELLEPIYPGWDKIESIDEKIRDLLNR